MVRVPKDTKTRVNEVMSAWEKMRPVKQFWGLTLDSFRLEVKPFLDAQAEIDDLQIQLQHAVSKLENAEISARKLVKRIVSAVKGDPQEGEDGGT